MNSNTIIFISVSLLVSVITYIVFWYVFVKQLATKDDPYIVKEMIRDIIICLIPFCNVGLLLLITLVELSIYFNKTEFTRWSQFKTSITNFLNKQVYPPKTKTHL